MRTTCATARCSRILKDTGRKASWKNIRTSCFRIYESPYKNKLQDKEIKGFTLASDIPVHYKIHLGTNEDVAALFKMTPYAYRTKKEDADKILSLSDLSVSANFRILTYRKV